VGARLFSEPFDRRHAKRLCSRFKADSGIRASEDLERGRRGRARRAFRIGQPLTGAPLDTASPRDLRRGGALRIVERKLTSSADFAGSVWSDKHARSLPPFGTNGLPTRQGAARWYASTIHGCSTISQSSRVFGRFTTAGSSRPRRSRAPLSSRVHHASWRLARNGSRSRSGSVDPAMFAAFARNSTKRKRKRDGDPLRLLLQGWRMLWLCYAYCGKAVPRSRGARGNCAITMQWSEDIDWRSPPCANRSVRADQPKRCLGEWNVAGNRLG